MKIDKNGNWKHYILDMNELPEGCEVIGVATTGSGSGALIRHEKRYILIRHGITRYIDGRTVAGALGKYGHGGRPKVIGGGKAVKVRLDAASIASARKLGSGNVSEGIRVALRGI